MHQFILQVPDIRGITIHPPWIHSRDIAADQSADALRSIAGHPTLSLVSRHGFIDMARPCRPSYPSTAIIDHAVFTSIDSPLQEACPSLRFHVDNSVWDLIQKEVMDWRDSSWTSVNLPGNKTCERPSSLRICRHQSHADFSGQPSLYVFLLGTATNPPEWWTRSSCGSAFSRR